jgi:hypothetical protein
MIILSSTGAGAGVGAGSATGAGVSATTIFGLLVAVRSFEYGAQPIVCWSAHRPDCEIWPQADNVPIVAIESARIDKFFIVKSLFFNNFYYCFY